MRDRDDGAEVGVKRGSTRAGRKTLDAKKHLDTPLDTAHCNFETFLLSSIVQSHGRSLSDLLLAFNERLEH